MTRHHGLHVPSGPPDIHLGSLGIWVRGGQFGASHDDDWDGNWLDVLIEVDAASAVVQAEGPILHASEVATMVEGCKRLHQTLTGEVVLAPMEPNFGLTLKVNAQGQLDVGIDISGDCLTQRHHFDFELDQSYLPRFIAGAEAVLQKYGGLSSHRHGRP